VRQPVRVKDRYRDAGDETKPVKRKFETVEFRSRVRMDFACRILLPGERASDRPSRIE
jgi:hypothetical protein